MNNLWVNNFIIVLIDLVGIFLALWVYFAQRKEKTNRAFFLMVVAILSWITFYHLASVPSLRHMSSVLFRLATGSVFIFFICYYYFIIQFLNKKGLYEIFAKFVLVYGFSFYLITLFTNLIIDSLEFKELIIIPIFSPGAWFIFYGYVIILTILIIILLTIDYFKAPKQKRQKIQYFLFGLLVFTGLNFIFNVVLQIFFNDYKFYQLGNYSAIFLLGFTAYAMVKQELFGIKSVITVFFVGSTALLLGVDAFVLTEDITLRITKTIILLGFLWLGYALIKSVQKEIKTSERLKVANQDLKELLESRSTFLSIASHQLRTPVSIAKGMLSMLDSGDVPKEKRAQFINRSFVNLERLSDIIHDLLSASAVEGKGFKLNKKAINIDEIVEKVIKEREITAKEKNLKLIYNKPKTPTPAIFGDENKLTEIIANLIDNSIQYTPKGQVEITVKTENKNYVFTIKDTGIGIKKEDMPKLFKKISRLPNAIQVRPSGTGLGLYLVKKVVEIHGGKVSVASEGMPGKGSVFTVTLPLKG